MERGSMNGPDDKASPEQGPAVKVFSGYFRHEGVTVRVDFQVQVGATIAEKDAAFLAALAQKADINYLAIGDSGEPLPEV